LFFQILYYFSKMSNSVCQMLHSYADEGQTTSTRTMKRHQTRYFLPSAGIAISELPPAQTCTISPIAPDHKPLRRCLHETSTMKASSPHAFLRFPYRPSLMTLLRRLETYPCDPVATETLRSNPLIYASIQNHWHPKIACPVLTVVSTCDTSMSPPFFHRSFVDFGRVSFYFSTAHDQTFATFDLPLMVPASEATKPIHCVLISSTDHVDIMNLYEIRSRGSDKAIARIQTFQLAPTTCTTLHDTSLHIPLQNAYPEERFLLGLSGCRNTFYHINYPTFEDPILTMLDDEDLIAIGIAYRQCRLLPRITASPYDEYPKPLIPRLAFHRTSRIDVDLLVTDELVTRIIHPGKRRSNIFQWPSNTSLYPPPRQACDIHFNLINVPPLKFPPGYVLYRFTDDVMRCKVTDFIQDIMVSYDLNLRSAAKNVFTKMFNCTLEQIKSAKFTEMETFLSTVDYRKPTLGKAPIWYITNKEADKRMRKWTRLPPHDLVPNPILSLPVVYEPDEGSVGHPITVHQSRLSMEDISDMVDILYDNFVPLTELQRAITARLQLEENLMTMCQQEAPAEPIPLVPSPPLSPSVPSSSSSSDDRQTDCDDPWRTPTDVIYSSPSSDDNDQEDSDHQKDEEEDPTLMQQDVPTQTIEQNRETDSVMSEIITPEEAEELLHQVEMEFNRAGVSMDLNVLTESPQASGDCENYNCEKRYSGYCNCDDCKAEDETHRFTRKF